MIGTAFAVIATACSGVAVGIAVGWAQHKFTIVRARLHHARRFFAGTGILISCEVPSALADWLIELGEHIEDRDLASEIMNMPFSVSVSDSEREDEIDAAVRGLSDDLLETYVKTIIAYVVTLSYLKGKAGRKFRTRLVDQLTDRRAVVTESRKMRLYISSENQSELVAA